MLQVLEKRIVHQSFEKAAVIREKKSLQQQLSRSSSDCSSIAGVNSSSSISDSSSGSDSESDDLVHKDQHQHKRCGLGLTGSSSSSSASSRCSSIGSCIAPLQPAGNAAAGYVPYWLRACAKQQQSSASGSGMSVTSTRKQQAGGSGHKQASLQLRPKWV
jgi:hypothetical protein